MTILRTVSILVALVALIAVAAYLLRSEPTPMGGTVTGAQAARAAQSSKMRALSQPVQSTLVLKVQSSSGIITPEPLYNFVAPVGTIAIWFQDTLPTGWVLCDGNNGTPNLKGMFPLGWKPTAKDPVTLKNRLPMETTGGSETVELTLAQMPKHTHTFANYTKRSGNYADNDNTTACADSGDWVENRVTSSTGTDPKGFPHENMPPFIVVKYIMKV